MKAFITFLRVAWSCYFPALVLLFALHGCAAKPQPRPSAPPPPAVSTIEVRRAMAVIGKSNASAQARTATIIQRVEVIRELPTTDPATASQLGEVQAELFKVSADLRETAEAKAQLETEIGIIEHQAEANRAWGIDMQTAAATNGQGWRDEEAAHAKTKIEAKHQTGLAWKWRLLTFGTWALAAAFFVARQYFPFLKAI